MICSSVYPFLTVYSPFYDIILGIVFGGHITKGLIKKPTTKIGFTICSLLPVTGHPNAATLGVPSWRRLGEIMKPQASLS